VWVVGGREQVGGNQRRREKEVKVATPGGRESRARRGKLKKKRKRVQENFATERTFTIAAKCGVNEGEGIPNSKKSGKVEKVHHEGECQNLPGTTRKSDTQMMGHLQING